MIEVVCVVYVSLHYTNQYALTSWNKRKYKHKKILLVTHGGICRAIYWYFNGYQKTETLQVLMKIARYMNYNYEKTKEVLNEK